MQQLLKKIKAQLNVFSVRELGVHLLTHVQLTNCQVDQRAKINAHKQTESPNAETGPTLTTSTLTSCSQGKTNPWMCIQLE